MKKRKAMLMQVSNADYREEKNSSNTQTVSKPTHPPHHFSPLSKLFT